LLKSRTEKLRKKLGGQHANAAIEAIDKGEFKHWIEIVLVYYDKTYNHSQNNSNKTGLGVFNFDWGSKPESCIKLLDFVQQIIGSNHNRLNQTHKRFKINLLSTIYINYNSQIIMELK
jgi:hypothetical protein